MLMIEEWRDIKGYEGLYRVSNLGNVWSCYVNRVLSKHLYPNGYYAVRLCKNGHHRVIQLGRLVAITFIPNPNNLPEVNHKDCNPKNNHADNLEWCTRKYNVNYGGRIQKMLNNPAYKARTERLKVPIIQCHTDGAPFKRWDSAHDAGRELRISISNINSCCRERRPSAGGYIWRYEKECYV